MIAKLSFMKDKVVFFDLDDTLYHEVDFLKSAYRGIASFIEINYHLQGIYAEMMGYWKAGKNVFECLLALHYTRFTFILSDTRSEDSIKY